MENKINNSFKKVAKEIVDSLFDNELFKDKLTRDDMQSLEDLLYTVMDDRYNSEKRLEKLMNDIKNK